MTQTISRETIKSLLDRGEPLTLVEALPPKYYDEGHLPGAINIPHDRLRQLAPTLHPDKEAFIAVYCASTSCRNSKIATDQLRALGYANAFEYVDGKQDWVDAGLPLDTSAAWRASQVDGFSASV